MLIPPALVLGCNTPHGIGVLSDWIEEQTGVAPDFVSTTWSDAADDTGCGFGYGYSVRNVGDGHGDGGMEGYDNGYGNGFGCGFGYGYGYGSSDSCIHGLIEEDGNGTGIGGVLDSEYGYYSGDGCGKGFDMFD